MKLNDYLRGLRDFWRRYRKNRAALLGLALLSFILFIALTAPFLTPYSPMKTLVGRPFETPFSSEHHLGTDDLGRDIFTMILFGAQASLLIGFLSAILGISIGVLAGSISGYYGGLIDDLVMRITELFMMIPRFPLALVVIAFFGNSIWNVIFVLGITSWPRTARTVRVAYMSLKQKEFVEAARAIGEKDFSIVFREILPNAIFLVIVNLSIEVPGAILLEVGLSYLGVGDPNITSWGMMLSNAQHFLRHAWWMAVFPGIAIFITVLGLNLVGDGLNDALNPKLKEM
jgi:peptide/nickel transport system permease protein